MRRLFTLAALAACAAASTAQTTGNINVSANVTAVCSIAVNPLAFGSYNPLVGAALRQSTTLSVTCSQGSVASIALGAGNSASGAQRRMANGASGYLAYSLFQPASNADGAACAYAAPWGDGSGLGSVLVTTPAAGIAPRTYNVCGEIAPGQNAPVAAYTDVVVASVTF